MAAHKPGLLGRKIGMTQIYDTDGNAIGVTVVEAGPNVIVRVKTPDSADGYAAIQIGFVDQKESRLTRPEQGHFKKSDVSPKRYLQELRVEDAEIGNYSVGQTLVAADVFAAGDIIDVISTSKGRGFAGVMKRHNMKGFIRSHGTHEYFRHGGSIGTRLTPGMVLKGKKMPGHMGSQRVTVQNLKVVKLDAENNLLFIKGGVPGPNGCLVRVRKGIKT